MRNEVIALKYKANGVIAIGVPITVLKILGGFPIDDQISAGIPIQAADDVQHCGFSASGGTENGDKFMRTEVDGYTVQRLNCAVTDGIGFGNVL